MQEKIIIDGVDVSKCCFYNSGKCDNPNGMACNCINNAVCYFKELKRLEQENEELKIVKEQLKKWNDENLKRQDDMQLWIDLAEEQRRKYRSALEEIRKKCNWVEECSVTNDNLW